MHVNPEQLVDIAEGTWPESSAPHLSGCEPCRAQLREMRAMMSAARDVDVPEPSPLFWDHLSSRVSEAVAAEAEAARLKGSHSLLEGSRSFGDVLAALSGARAVFGARAFQASVAVAAALLIAVALGTRAMAPAPVATPPPIAVADAGPAFELLADVESDGDASLALVASLTDDVDLDTAREAGLASGGSAEHAVTHMSDAELRELRRLLNEELTRSGA